MAITIRNLRKTYNGKTVFENLSLTAGKGKITAIFGPNGCGKSTLFNIIAGLVEHDGGEYVVHNFDRFRFSYVFQNYRDTLLPWRSNGDNIGLPLEIQRMSKQKQQKHVQELLDFFAFPVDLTAYPYQLSGGQQQFLVFLRSLINRPAVVLLDEPFSALDYENNIRLRNKLQEYQLLTNATIFIITHDIEEAVYLASEIIVLSRAPSRILGTVANPLPYPRSTRTLQLAAFHAVKNKVLQLFYQEVGL